MKIILELNPIQAVRAALEKFRETQKRKFHERRRDALLARAKMNIFQ